MKFGDPRSPLTGQYLLQNRLAVVALRVIDTLLSIVTAFSLIRPAFKTRPKRILLANGAHMGDAVIASAQIAVVKGAFPDAQIGVLVGSWSLPVVKGCRSVEWIHTTDHWKLNRSSETWWRKLQKYIETRRDALSEIRRVGYDVAIDLYFHFPNFIPLLWQAGIPQRVGYTSGGFGPLLTLSLRWRYLDQHVAQYHADLIRALVKADDGQQAVQLKYSVEQPEIDGLSGLLSLDINPSRFIVVHMGTGSSIREWPVEKWRQLCTELSANGFDLVFTGIGPREAMNANAVVGDLPRCCNLVGQLDWETFLGVLKRSIIVVCVESLAGHLAAAVDTPCVAIWSGIANPYHWKPMSDDCRLLLGSTECAPCYRSSGCSAMECVRGVSVEEVLQAVHELHR